MADDDGPGKEGFPGEDEYYHNPYDHGGLVSVTFDADWSEDRAGFHDWNQVLRYDDGTTVSDFLGTWDDEPPDWVWDIFEWWESEWDVEVDTDYEET